ncbi:MAG TPA: acyl-CoA thioesterase/bile acid-CoA:amino acid N-acyltransferase family protein [Kofleriaceae bacterium]
MRIRFHTAAGETGVRYPGEQIAIEVDGLVPGEPCTIRLARRWRDAGWQAWLEARADAGGTVDTRTAVPLAGSYAGADPDGLFWSMTRTAGEAEVTTGWRCAVAQGDQRAHAVLEAGTLRPGIRAEPLPDDGGGGIGVVGMLYVPEAGEPRGAVLCLGGSGGGLEGAAESAQALANHGFVTLALAYFGAPGLPASLAAIPLEYFDAALDRLRAHPAVRPDRIGVLGRSRGGELALLLGAERPELAAVVAAVASPYRWTGVDGGPAWTRGGAAVAYLGGTGAPARRHLSDGRTLIATAPVSQRTLATADAATLEAACCAIERTRGPILLLAGDDDQVWPSAELAARAAERLTRRTVRYADEAITYPGAGHAAVSLPGNPTTEPVLRHPMGFWLMLGGTPDGDARAQRAAWDRVREFLRRHLAGAA